MHLPTAFPLLGVLGLATMACAQSVPPSQSPAPPTSARDAATRALEAQRSASPSPQLLAAVRSDAARRAGVPEAALELVAVESLTWPDGGLGCARPDEMVTQAQVPGFRILLRAQGATQVLAYHTDRRMQFRHCAQSPQLLPPGHLPTR